MVERRAQILMISLRDEDLAASALASRYPSTNGPFHTERAILLTLVAAADDQAIRPLVAARLVTLRRLPPWRDRVTSTGAAAFATAQRMIDRVHDDTAVVRLEAQPAHAAGLAQLLVHVVRVGHSADRGDAFRPTDTNLAGHQLDLGVAAVLADQLRESA